MNDNNKKFVTINEISVTCDNDEYNKSNRIMTNNINNNNCKNNDENNNDSNKMDENEYISRKNYISNQYKMASVSYGMLFCLIGVVLT